MWISWVVWNEVEISTFQGQPEGKPWLTGAGIPASPDVMFYMKDFLFTKSLVFYFLTKLNYARTFISSPID